MSEYSVKMQAALGDGDVPELHEEITPENVPGLTASAKPWPCGSVVGQSHLEDPDFKCANPRCSYRPHRNSQCWNGFGRFCCGACMTVGESSEGCAHGNHCERVPTSAQAVRDQPVPVNVKLPKAESAQAEEMKWNVLHP